MPSDQARMLESLRTVRDPQLRRSIVDLGMIRALRTKRGRTELVLALPTPDHPDRELLRREVEETLARSSDGKVSVEATVMSDEERAALHGVLAAGRERPKGPTPKQVNPFTLPSSSTRIIGVSSGKGGVGKSSVAVNLAVSLARAGLEVAILDADVYGFSIPGMLGVSHDPLVIDDLLIPPVAHGVACISIGFFVRDDQPVIWRGPMLHKALEQFLVDVHWGRLDYLVVDMPPGTGDVALSMAEHLPKSEVIVVTTPQPAAQRVAQRSAFAARKLKLPLRGVVENMSWFSGDDGKRYELFGSGGGELLARDLGVPLLAQVPLVPAVRSGGDAGTPITVSDPVSEASVAFERLASEVVEMGPARRYRKELTVR